MHGLRSRRFGRMTVLPDVLRSGILPKTTSAGFSSSSESMSLSFSQLLFQAKGLPCHLGIEEMARMIPPSISRFSPRGSHAATFFFLRVFLSRLARRTKRKREYS